MKLKERTPAEKRDYLIAEMIEALDEAIPVKGPVKRRSIIAVSDFFKNQYEALLSREKTR